MDPVSRPRPAALSSYLISSSIVRSALWKEDGNVILQAEQTQFRVHRSFLADHSDFFEDMFKLATAPTDGEELVDGCPVIQLEDTAEDLTHVLMALYSRGYFSHTDVQPLPTVAALLRLGRKYGFDDLRAAAIAVLQREYPRDLDVWQKSRPGAPETTGFIAIEYYTGLEIDVVNLAREQDVECILPLALLRLVESQPVSAIFDGVTRADGTVARCLAANQRAAILGREALVRDQLNQSYAWLVYGDDPACTTPAKCQAERDKLHAALSAWLRERLRIFVEWNENWHGNMCPGCVHMAEMAFLASKEVVFRALPTYFDLPAWSALLAKDV